MAIEAELAQKYKEKEKQFGPCKLCGKKHTYMRTIGIKKVEWPSGRLSLCPTFQDLTVEEKAKLIEDRKFCPRCL